MRNNFVPSFHKKETDSMNKNIPTFLIKNGQTLLENHSKNTTKKLSFHIEPSSNQYDTFFSNKNFQQIDTQSFSSDQKSSCKSSQRTIKPSKNDHMMTRQKQIVSPIKYHHTSPLKIRRPSISPRVKQSQLSQTQNIPIRATLKNLLHNKILPIRKNEEQFNESKNYSMQTYSQNGYCVKINTQTRAFSPRNWQRQYYILKQQNEHLRRQIYELKNVNMNNNTKKDESINNLRNTIKRQDNELKQLKIKLEIYSKKNIVLQTLIQNKDEQIVFLSNKIEQIEQQYKEYKDKSIQKFEKLKQRINIMLKSYNDIEIKWNHAQLQWLDFKQSWLEQKQTYIQRISFLQTYIAEN